MSVAAALSACGAHKESKSAYPTTQNGHAAGQHAPQHTEATQEKQLWGPPHHMLTLHTTLNL